jgi:LacI family transcriptional regulator
MQKSHLPTLKDVARLAGVSYQTVSNVINGETRISDDTRQRVLDAIEELGYQPHAVARSLRSGHSNIIGLMIPDAHNPHFWDTVSGAEDEANLHGYSILLATTGMDKARERRAFDALLAQRLDGLIPLFTYPEDFVDDLNALKRRNFPVSISFSGAPMPDVAVDIIWAHFDLAAHELMAHLLGLGHRRIAMVWGVGRSELGNDRLTAYREELAKAGIVYNPDYVASCGNTLEDSVCAAEKLFSLDPLPTAIIGINDVMAFGAMQVAMSKGLRIPQDISIAGFDDLPQSRFLFPALTSGKADGEEIGRQCVRMVLERLSNPALSQQIIHLPTHLIVRGSTGACPEDGRRQTVIAAEPEKLIPESGIP